MAIFATTQTGAGPLYNLATFQDLVVPAQVILTATSGNAIYANEVNDIVIFGQVYAQESGVEAAGDIVTVTISENAMVFGTDYGLEIMGDFQSVSNYGEIYGDSGVVILGRSSEILNFGVIHGASYEAVSIASDGGLFVNHGTVSTSGIYSAVLMYSPSGLTPVTLENHGTIFGGGGLAYHGDLTYAENVYNYGAMTGGLCRRRRRPGPQRRYHRRRHSARERGRHLPRRRWRGQRQGSRR